MSTSVKVTVIRLVVLLSLYTRAAGFIVPEEVPTVLSVIYSNIPPIKKGTDSRLGVGFRLGEHADFQVLVELGPQTETDPIGNVDAKKRRQATLNAAMRGELGPWAQTVAQYQTQRRIQKELEEMLRLREKLMKLRNEEANRKDEKNNESDVKTVSSDWLGKWSEEMVQSPEVQVPSESLPIQRILPRIAQNRNAVQRVNETPKDVSSFGNKMKQLATLYNPQPSVQSV
ncbi:uncharacterized protein LOC107271613 [Cephus cinctus]|uniref:Uncharacterized protein LOC107271613 n=1 Tax=Cephus cinctus TaxID=211228 RepID=A0AAJ7RPN4_CEPCN|nr:uncharacterized protein LOC107271613 [Cephus cinctus]XP_024944797.1 uncharacterized protein LOC107271613 [Cephus cinctus]XP_024944800.1 uncharacterized protein LOC107271613 [Cephus cinctus]XP_024944802.1 uncharacterized protein LOC107271613 [Cephus cinctus]XP_024944807.1 uncharacterized protein LOC107271613 [Cephus cinctus]